MKTLRGTGEIVADDDGKWTDSPTPKSGGNTTQLKGFDARKRKIAGPNGVNRTPDIIAKNHSRIRVKQEWRTPNEYFEPNRQRPEAPKPHVKWDKRYDLTAPAEESKEQWSKKTPVKYTSPDSRDYRKGKINGN